MKRILSISVIVLASTCFVITSCRKEPEVDWHEVTCQWGGFSVMMPGEPVTFVNEERLFRSEEYEDTHKLVIEGQYSSEREKTFILDYLERYHWSTKKKKDKSTRFSFTVSCYELGKTMVKAEQKETDKGKYIKDNPGCFDKDTVINGIPRWVCGFDDKLVENYVNESHKIYSGPFIIILAYRGPKGKHEELIEKFFSSFRFLHQER